MGGTLRAVSLVLAGALATVCFLGFTLALNGYQLTEEATGRRLLERSLVALTDLDAALPSLQDSLRQAASEAQGPMVVVPDFPVTVEVSLDEAMTLAGQELRQRLLSEAAARMYREGSGALLADPEAGRRLETTSMPWALEHGLGLITEETHSNLLVAMMVLGALSLLLLVPVLWVPPLWGRVSLLGAVLLVASLPPLAGALGVRFFLRTMQGDADPFVHQLLQVGIEAMTVPVRNYLALSALGSGLLLVAALMVWAGSRGQMPALTGEEDLPRIGDGGTVPPDRERA